MGKLALLSGVFPPVPYGGEPTGREGEWASGRFPSWAVLVGGWVAWCPAEAVLIWGLSGRCSWGRRQSKALAKAFLFLLACGSLRRIWTWALTAGTRKVGDTVTKDRVVRSQVAWRRTKVGVV